MSAKSALSSAAVVLCSALAVSACQSATPSTSAGAPAPGGVTTSAVSSPAAPTAADSSASTPQSTAPKTTAASGPATSRTAPASATSASVNATSDSYAYNHECTSNQLSVTVTRLNDAPTRRLITVVNKGANSCGLSYYPRIDIGNSKSADQSHNIRPMIPGGLGGPPAYALYAGRTAYAVIDLDPTGAAASTVPGLDEMNVLADSAWPNAATKNIPLGAGTVVQKPKLGLYQHSTADAVLSMQGADMEP